MKKIENLFDINMVLMMLYSVLEQAREKEGIELVFDIEQTVPKELRGDPEALTRILSQLVNFVIHHCSSKEIVLHLSAPEDFLYEEEITFSLPVDPEKVTQRKIESFFRARLNPMLERVEGKAEVDADGARILLHIPFKLGDLGNRRYYRLPDIGMLGKKVLIITNSKAVSESLRKMFRYFLYEVDVGAEEYKKRGGNLALYDIFVLEDSLLTDGIAELVTKIQKKEDLKFVLLEDANTTERKQAPYISAYLVKPVMQESIFELIVSLFEKDVKERKIKNEAHMPPEINMEQYLNEAFKKSEEAYAKIHLNTDSSFDDALHEDAQQHTSLLPPDDYFEYPILDTREGEEKARKYHLDYTKELKKFVDTFSRSDYYFKEIVQNKAVWQIKEFTIDLEKRSAAIGAKRMARFAEKVGLIFIYNKLEMLPVYANKYHQELQKLMLEISAYLRKRRK